MSIPIIPNRARGLPIGALTSQNFANYYFSGLGRLLLSRRRKRRYAECRRDWEEAYSNGLIDSRTLQVGYAAAQAITAHADAVAWRREQLRRRPLADSLVAQ